MADADKQQQPSTEDILSSIRRAISSEEEGEQTRRKDSAGSGELNDDVDAEKLQELSTEEILSSIGRIISSGEEGGGATREAGIIPGKSNVDIGALNAHDDSFSSETEATGQTESDNEVLELTVVIENGVDVDVATEELVSTSTTGHHKETSPDITSIKVGELATQLMRPVMLEWLNQNLPPMVKRLVRAEIDRLKQESR